MTWVEDDNLILPGLVVVLIEGKKLVDSQIWEHAADAIQENVGTAVLILDGDMVDDPLMNVLHELRRMGITGQRVLGVLCLGRIVLLFLQLVFQHGWMTQELLLVEKVAKLLKQIQRKYIHMFVMPVSAGGYHQQRITLTTRGLNSFMMSIGSCFTIIL